MKKSALVTVLCLATLLFSSLTATASLNTGGQINSVVQTTENTFSLFSVDKYQVVPPTFNPLLPLSNNMVVDSNVRFDNDLTNNTFKQINQSFLLPNLLNWRTSLFSLVAPSVSSISPSIPTSSSTDQNITVRGSNFVSGLTVTVFFPSGGTGTLSGTQIQSVSSTSFVMRVTLNATGTWCIRVNNPNGEVSSNFCFSVQAAQSPSISSISPSSPTVSSSNQNVDVSGNNFQSGLTVTVFFPNNGGSSTLSGSQIQNVSTTSFRMVVTLNIVGTYGIRVNNPNGLTSGTFNFTTRAASPSISSISPTGVCAQNGDRTFTVNGTNFRSGLTVTVFFPGGGSSTLSGTQIQFSSSSSFNMIVTLNIVGTYNFRVNNTDGTTSANFSYATQNCNPNITSISPAIPTVSNSNQTVGVSGSNFQSGLTVTVFFPGGGSSTLSGSQIQFGSSSSFNMTITLNLIGTYQIRVNNPNGTTSSNFSFNTQAASPSVSSISPSNPCVRNIDQSVTVNGSNFSANLTVSVTFPTGSTGTLSGTQIQNVTASSFTMIITVADPGTYTIRVNNPGGAQSSPFAFSTQNCLMVSGINPSSPTQSNVDQNVTVNGNGFAVNLTVTVTFPDGTTGTLSGTQIQNVTATSFLMKITLNAAGTWKIKVRNTNGDLSNIQSFTVQAPAPPTVTSINPASPTASNVDQNIIVNGSNFQNGLNVTVTFPNGGTGILSGTQIQNVTATSFTMRITLGNAGNWNLRVNNPNGGQSALLPFTVQSGVQSPVIFSINPTNPIAGNTNQDVIVIGSNFQQNLTVLITFPSGGGTTLSGTQIQNVTATSFVMRATLNAAGNWSIRVNNPDGGQSTVFSFSVASGGNNPTISSINPSAPISNGADQNVIVNGTNFQNGLKVNVSFPNGGIATLQGTGQIQNVTANSFLMRITVNDTGNWNIRVINPDNSQSVQFNFNVQASGPPPTGIPTSVLSPVIGPLRVTTSNQGIGDGKWEFNQYKSGYHTPTGGISLSNDTYAWDVNLYTSTSGNADAGKAVFAVADGEVVSYVGTQPGEGPGAVLVAHPNASNPVWFSGYLHMTNVKVTLNQQVNSTTVIGDIGRVGTNNDHLHFVVYSGQNTRGNLRSFNATILERSTSTTNPPVISSIEPNTVNQSSTPQLISITGSNFQPNSIIEVQAPDGQYFTVTPDTTSVLAKEAKIVRDEQAKIESIESGTITAFVNFTSGGNYEFTVINRPTTAALSGLEENSFAESSSNSAESSFAVSSGSIVYAVPSGRTPVILIPGIMGSRIGQRQPNGIFRPLWLAGIFNDDEHRELANEVENPSIYRPIWERNVVATEIIRNVGISIDITDVYGNLIDYLTKNQGYTLDNAQYPTMGQCDSSRNSADLFVFPYDWRNSNRTSAQDLQNFVQCIKNIRGDPANFKVDIIAHSMGGLVARRYILNNPETHHIDRMVTLGTPWLGAPKTVSIIETGYYDFWVNRVIKTSVLKQIAPSIKGAHELIPSKAYTDDLTTAEYGSFPLGEMGWDFNFDQMMTTRYNFSQLKTAMNIRYNNRPGDTTDIFHSLQGQDQWSTNNLFGVSYYQFVGYGKNTIGSVIAKKEPFVPNHIAVANTNGDGTVPLVSATRMGRQNYRGPIKLEKGFPLSHGELASHKSIFPFINCVVNVPDADACINNTSFVLKAVATDSALKAVGTENYIGEPNYLLKVIGSSSVIITDSFGNTTNPLSTSVDAGVRTVQTDVVGDNYLNATFPLDQNYKVAIRTPQTPLSIILIKSDGQTVTQAIRYVDVTLPANVLALIEITPQGVTLLKYDSDGNGTFDTSINPTIDVTGVQAQDIEAPEVVVNETVQNGSSQIVLQATDAGTGVQRIMYSLNGSSFQQYTAPLSLNAVQTPTIYAFADDNVANRSGLVTYNLANSSVNVSGIVSYGTTPTGQATKYVPGVLLTAAGAPQVTATSNLSGVYQLSGLGNGAYTVTPTKTGDTNSINSFDAALIRQAGVQKITLTANQRIAADANNDGLVNSYDAALVRRAGVGLTNSDSIIGRWKFVDPARTYPSVVSNLLNENYQAILIGEVSGEWQSTITSPPAGSALLSDNQEVLSDQVKQTRTNKTSLETAAANEQEATPSASNGVLADVTVSLPASTVASNGTIVTIPITTTGLTGRGVIAYNLDLRFDPSVLQLTTTPVQSAGTISSSCFIESNSRMPGQLSVGCDLINELSGAGTLLNIQFNVIGAAGNTRDLTLQSFVFNGGTPTVQAINGMFKVTGQADCSFIINPTSQTFSSSGGSQVIIVSTQAGCPWVSSTNDSFITINGENQSSGTLTFTVALNTGAARTGTIMVAGQTFTVNQAAYVKSRKRARFF